MRMGREVHQAARPRGRPLESDFAFADVEIPEPGPGTALVENVYLSVDPYMREMMDSAWPLGAPLEGRAIGRVIASRETRLPEGRFVFHRKAWRTHAVVEPASVRLLPEVPGLPLSAYLGIFGGTGLTAYVALTRVAGLKPGEDVFISAAAGGVGTAAAQIARFLGARRLIGSAGSAAKVKHLIERLGFDAAFDYHDGNVTELLAKAAPEGIDVCVENVGAEHLEAAIACMRPHGRIAWSGAVAQYDDLKNPPCAPRTLYQIVNKALRLEGFLVRENLDLQDELEARLTPEIVAGRLKPEETVVDGFENAVKAFLSMLAGGNVGKMIVRAGADERR